MLDLRQYTCLGAALRDALDRFSSEICLIEAERDREKLRLTYSDFKEIALPLARALEDADFDPNDRAAIIMTNQSKWLISAYAIFLLRRCAGAARLQAHGARAPAVAGALKGESTRRRVPPVARDHAGTGLSQRSAPKLSSSRKLRWARIWRARFAGRISSARALPISSCARKTT
jgi:hypothetical protein